MPDTAIIIVDMQHAFCAPGGALERRGDRLSDAAALFDRVDALIERGRRGGVPVIFTRVVLDPATSSDTPIFRRLAAQSARQRDYLPDAADAQLMPRPARQSDDVVVDKAAYDAFHGTDLEARLRDAGIRRLVVAGVLTNVCVESTVRSAFERGFEVVVVEDATDTYSAEAKAASLATIRRCFGEVLTLDQLMLEKRASP